MTGLFFVSGKRKTEALKLLLDAYVQFRRSLKVTAAVWIV